MTQSEIRLSWTSHPLLDDLPRTIFLIIIIILVSLILYQTTIINWQAPLYFFLGMLFFLGSMITWFIPTTYSIYDDKIVIKYPFFAIEKKWGVFGCWYADKKGVMLGTFKRPRRLDNFRGQSLRFSKDKSEKDALFAILNEKIGNNY
jgi:hypothetical protein